MPAKIFIHISKLLPLSFCCCAIISLLDLILLPNSLRFKLTTIMSFLLFTGLTLFFLWLEKQFKLLEQATYLKTSHLKALNRLRLIYLVGSFLLSVVFFGLFYGMANRIFNGIPLLG